MKPPGDITQLLRQWTSGDPQAGDALAPLIYDELHKLAAKIFRTERRSHTLQPTALLHDAYEKLLGVDVSWQDRAHFYSLAARMMRRLLVNHASSRAAEKRGGSAVCITLDESSTPAPDHDVEILALDAALVELATFDERKAELIQLQYFGGLTFKEMQEVTELSSSTIDRELRFARAWLKDQMDST